jgi:hypothetical protein
MIQPDTALAFIVSRSLAILSEFVDISRPDITQSRRGVRWFFEIASHLLLGYCLC